MADLKRQMADAEALLYRVSAEGRQAAQRRRRQLARDRLRAVKRIGVAIVAILLAAIAWGFIVGPIGQGGFLLVLAAIVAAMLLIPGLSRSPVETPQTLATSDLPRLPQRTEAWLQRQRPLLPPPAARLADGIATRLETLGGQLAALDPAGAPADEVRKLLSIELPELVEGYTRLPPDLRRRDRDGLAPDRQLVEGLGVIDGQLARLSADLATADLQKLATQGRYLELKYKDDGAA